MWTKADIPIDADAVDDVRAALCCARDEDDARIAGLIAAAILQCEDYTGRMVIVRDCRETFDADGTWRHLSGAPVEASGAVERVDTNDGGHPLEPTHYDWRVDDERRGHFRLLQGRERVRIAYRAGQARDWRGLSPRVRLGVSKLVLHWYRGGERGEGARVPTEVAGLWRAERRLRLG